MSPQIAFILGLSLALGGALILWRIFRMMVVAVPDEEAVLITRFGKLDRVLTEPGLHIFPGLLLPWISLRRVSQQVDFREIDNIQINDATGTTLIVDLWLEFRIVDPAKAAFAVQDWDRSLRNVASHATRAILSNLDFNHILTDRTDLCERLKRDLHDECQRWGLLVSNAFVRHVRLLPEVSRLMFETVAARKERAKARIEEEGRLAVAMLDAETDAKVAKLVADAKSQYPLAMGEVFSELKQNAAVFAAYNTLYELSQLRPHRTVAFVGFDGLRATDAAMMSPSASDALLAARNERSTEPGAE
ncbi:MAG: SPFH/Band 7/PHB domain protein [Myxococcales bacterium]|nr:SPFH/Band 7/PHB domain protein [Myxococcales bacterium]